MKIYRRPGWLAPQGLGTLTKPAHRPVLDTSDDAVYKCQPLKIGTPEFALTKPNAGGAQTMRQGDYASWIRTWIGDPPKS